MKTSPVIRPSRPHPPHALRRLSALLAGSGLLAALPAIAQQAGDAGTQSDTILITAQKRPELISKAPLSVTAIRGDTLVTQGANDVTTLGALTPNAQFTKNAAGETILTVRGIGSSDVTETGDPNVSFNLDGVYIGRPAAIAGVLFDVERVELLRGPQGTLYGRNATSGSVNIISRAPVLGKLGGAAAAEIGNYQLRTLFGAVNAPLGDSVALRAAVQGSKRDGWGANAPAPKAFQDDDQTSARLRLKWAASESVTVNAGIDRSTQKGVGAIATRLSVAPLATSPQPGHEVVSPVSATNDLHLDRRNQGAFAQVDWELPFATLTYIGAHRKNDRDDVNANPRFGAGGAIAPLPSPPESAFDNTQRQKQTTHELRLGSDEGAVQWTAGLYHFDERQHTRLFFRLINALSDKPDIRSASDAAFGQATFKVATGLRATAGLRYTRDHKSQPGGEINLNGLIAGSDKFDKTWNTTNWKLGLDYDLGKDVLVYASAGTGFKAGGYRLNGAIASEYEPEKVTALEAGLKGSFLDRKLYLTAAVFRNDYRDFQATALTTINGAPATIVNNAQKALTQGLELEAVLRPDTAWRFNASLGLLDAKYKTFVIAGGDAFSGGAAAIYSGQRMANAPRATANLGVEYRFALGVGTLTPRLQTHYEATKNLDYHGFPVTSQGSFTKSDLMLTFEAPDRKWSVLAYVRNLENDAILSNASAGATGANAANRNIGFGNYSAPRTYGLRGSLEF